MEISELKIRKHQLEKDITKKISQLVEEFSKETGVVPSRISIDVGSVSPFGLTVPIIGYVSSATVDIEI